MKRKARQTMVSDAVKAIKVATTEGMGNAEWLKFRRQGICGSDAAAITGLSGQGNGLTVYLDKISGDNGDDNEGEGQYWSRRYEENIAREFARRTESVIVPYPYILQHPEKRFVLGRVQCLVIDHDGTVCGLACGTADSLIADEWKDGKVPEAYQIKCHHYMLLTGLPHWYIAILFGGNRLELRKVERNEIVAEYLLQIESAFWKMVEKRIPPSLDGTETTTKIINRLFPEAKTEALLQLAADLAPVINDYQRSIAEIKRLENVRDMAANALKYAMGNHENALCQRFHLRWKNVVAKRFDVKAFQEVYPDLYAQFCRESISRRFSIRG